MSQLTSRHSPPSFRLQSYYRPGNASAVGNFDLRESTSNLWSLPQCLCTLPPLCRFLTGTAENFRKQSFPSALIIVILPRIVGIFDGRSSPLDLELFLVSFLLESPGSVACRP